MTQIKNELTSSIPKALANFDDMPNAAFIRLPAVALAYGFSKATVWRNVKKGTMPSPKKLSERVTAWNVGEIKADLAAKAGV